MKLGPTRRHAIYACGCYPNASVGRRPGLFAVPPRRPIAEVVRPSYQCVNASTLMQEPEIESLLPLSGRKGPVGPISGLNTYSIQDVGPKTSKKQMPKGWFNDWIAQ